MWWVGHAIGGLAGALVVFVILVGMAGYMYARSRKQPVHAGNVNDEWSAPAEAEARVKEMAA